ncbi:phosphonoacetaldehyde hydrolase [Thalassoglobus sp.]|uniref:phosphonoacetaldehyde hydrolase n=1 Tax=Thalassoglobus sp. TaxID=2795869 RepID=UPI003AA8AD87
MTKTLKHLNAIVFDWAGTTVDHGSCAPAIVFQEIFRQRGVKVTAAQAREPMGMAKRAHIATVVAMPSVAKSWEEKYGSPCSDADIDAMYADFLPLQKKTLKDHSQLIPGVAEAIQECRALGLKIGSSTGYTHELMESVTAAAKEQGYEPDCLVCSEDAPAGRPAPYLLYEVSKQLEVYPLWSMIKVDDTPVGIEAGRNAGCWTVAITRTGNCVGLSEQEVEAISPAELQEKCQAAEERFHAAGAHIIIESVADIVEVVHEIEARMERGEMPV